MKFFASSDNMDEYAALDVRVNDIGTTTGIQDNRIDECGPIESNPAVAIEMFPRIAVTVSDELLSCSSGHRPKMKELYSMRDWVFSPCGLLYPADI